MFKRFTQMTTENLVKLLTTLRPYITKQETNMHDSITAEERLYNTEILDKRYCSNNKTLKHIQCTNCLYVLNP